MSNSVDITCSLMERSKMDRRSWPWKKKSSDKSFSEKEVATLNSAGDSLASGGSQADKEQEKFKRSNYVQISIESYSHLNGLENQVKTYEEQVKEYEEQAKAREEKVKELEEEINDLNEQVSAANSEISTKEQLVKQHVKVAEEAVSGWEKAEAEALSLKNHLESMTLAKLTAEDRAAHLDDALKECMRQIRDLKEDNEQKLHEVTLTKNKQYDRVKHELETKIASLDQELMRAEAESDALSRSLQERSNMLIKVNDEKSKAEAEIELLKSNVQTCEREITSLKYELHIVSKELEIRNEEKNMSVKSAEAANKQQFEGAKKIAKLEAECQRLRCLVRKKLPGPAALAQMKLEVESLGRESGESRLRRSPARPRSPQLPSNPHMSPLPEFSLDGAQKFQKENEYLTERLLALEEEIKMLKEELEKRNSELQTSRSICAKTASKLQSLEAQVQNFNKQKGLTKVDIPIHSERCFSQHASNPPSMTSFSEGANDDKVSCAESSASILISELSHSRGNNKELPTSAGNGKHLELMDDFEEMEKLARLTDSSSVVDEVNGMNNASKNVFPIYSSANTSLLRDVATSDPKLDMESLPLVVNLQSRISELFKSASKESDVVKILDDIKHVVQDVHDNLSLNSINCVSDIKHCSYGDANQVVTSYSLTTTEKEESLSGNGNPIGKIQKIGEELSAAISQIHSFVVFLGKEARSIYGASDYDDDLGLKVDELSSSFTRVMCNENNLDDFVSALSCVMARASELKFSVLGYKGSEEEVNSPDCIDRIALSENKSPQGKSYSNACDQISETSSNPEVPQGANITSGFEAHSLTCSIQVFEQLKAEKDTMEREVLRCSKELETAKSHLHEIEKQLEEVKSELALSQKMNSLADTQLQCMAEAYNILEKRANELESEVNVLKARLESLDNELDSAKVSHQDALDSCQDLEERLERNDGCSVCSSSVAVVDDKTKQEKDTVAAAEKLADGQETISLLSKQLKTFRPRSEFVGSPIKERGQRGEGFYEDEPTTSGMSLNLDQVEMDDVISTYLSRLGSEGEPWSNGKDVAL